MFPILNRSQGGLETGGCKDFVRSPVALARYGINYIRTGPGLL
jgi:hypothetical protein